MMINVFCMINKMYIVFDTETTGVPSDGWKDWSECHLIQIGWIIADENFKPVATKSFIVKNGGQFNSTPGALAVHHITDGYREAHGVSFATAIREFMNDCANCSGIVCHGAMFDVGLLIKDAPIYGFDISGLRGITVYDTKRSEHYAGLYMNLAETVHKISPTYAVPMNGANAHDALYDAYLCLELFSKSDISQLSSKFESYEAYLSN